MTHADRRKRSVVMVLCCTVFGAAAQILIKHGANNLTNPSVAAMLSSLPLMTGYALYGLSTVLLVLALRHGQLSILYPVISLTYVWVTVLSVAIFRESMNAMKLAGVAIIVIGVGVLGRNGKR